MSEHTVRSYENELESLSTHVAQMGGVAEALLQGAITRSSAATPRLPTA